MVALLVGLKLRLLRNSLRRSVWRTVGLIIGLVYGLGMVLGVLAGLFALRFTSATLTADVTVLGYALLTAGWLLMSLVAFGVDETVDPARFALLPVRARELVPGLLAAALVGVPGVATVILGAGLVLTWAGTPARTAAAVVAFPLGVLTCVLLARTVTAALASVLASRRFRDLAFVGLALFGIVFGLGANLLGALGSSDPDVLRAALADTSRIAGWTPFGWAWAVPADVARGDWPVAGVHLMLAIALAGVLWRTWEHFLDLRLTSPVEGSGDAVRVRGSGLADRLYPASPAGAIAARTLRYWRRDPRYLAGIAGLLIAPVAVIVSQLVNRDGSAEVAAFAPSILAMVVGMSVAQDLSYDGSALWLHVASGVRGADDRAGRVRSTLTVYVPLTLLMFIAAIGFSGQWSLAVPVAGLTVGLMLISLGVGAYVGTLWQWPAPPPGANPFRSGNNGGMPALASFLVSSLGTLLIALPVIGLVVWSFFTPWVGLLAPPVGLLIGLVVLRIGISRGGRMLDRRWPEVLQAVSEKSG